MAPMWAMRLGIAVQLAGLAAAIMDIRHFALPDPPELVSFVDPGVPPPSFIFALDQNAPPYDLSVPTMEPLPGCDSSYGSLCSIQHAIRLVTRARVELCPLFGGSTADAEEALAKIDKGDFTAESATGFGLFAFLDNGTIVADHLHPELIGERIDGYKHAGLVVQNWMQDYVTWVTDYGGGFVPIYTTRVSKVALDVLAGDAPLPASMYVERCPTGERLAVAFGREPIPAAQPCNPMTNAFCALQNIKRLAGAALVEILNCNNYEEMTQILHGVSYTDDYKVDAFYTYVSELSWYGYPGSDPWRNEAPLEDTYSTFLATGNLPDIYNGVNFSYTLNTSIMADGAPLDIWLTSVLGSAAWAGGAAQHYSWSTEALGDHLKVALIAGLAWNGTGLLVGSGIVHSPAERLSGPLCTDCINTVALPCALANSLSLVSHARTQMLTVAGVWEDLSYDPWFGADHANAYTNTKIDTWTSGFYVRAFSYNGSCVADGHDLSNIGRNFTEILGSWEAHERLIQAADYDGGWVSFETLQGATDLLYSVKVRDNNQDFYLVGGFTWAWGDLKSDCSSLYSEECSNHNAEVAVGGAAAAVLASIDQTELFKVLESIEGRTGSFSADNLGDFQVHIYNEDWECVSGVTTCPPEITEGLTDIEDSLGVDGIGWTDVVVDEVTVHAFVIHAYWKAAGSFDTVELHLVTMIDVSPGRLHCTSNTQCVTNSACSTSDRRCECDVGFATNLSTMTSTCGGYVPTKMICVDVQGQDCTTDDSSTIDITACSACAAGSFCPSGQPFQCPEGQYCPQGSSSPIPCPAGSFSSTYSQSECEACPVGHAAPEAAAVQCSPCVAGSYAAEVGQLACSICPKGTYISDSAQDSCELCPAGTTTSAAGATDFSACAQCEEGYAFNNYTCEACPFGFTTSSGDSTSCSIRTEITGSLAVVALITVFSSVFSFVLHRIYRMRLAALQAKAEAATEATVRRGLATIEDFGHPMVLMVSGDFMDLSKEDLRGLHEGNRDAHRLFFVDNYSKFQGLQNSGLKVIFLSYQWLSWTTKGPSELQWEYMKHGVSEVIAKNKWSTHNTFVWLDILSIPQEHRRVQSLAVDSLYVYAKCADALVVICPKTMHENTKEVADLGSYQSRVWCRVEVLARCCTRGLEQVYILDESGFVSATPQWAANMVRVFDGQMTCCRQGHNGGTTPCDRCSLILPLLGLYYEGITTEDMTPGLAFFQETILKQKDDVFQRHFNYSTDTNGGFEVQELFGDLIDRVDLLSSNRPRSTQMTTCTTDMPANEDCWDGFADDDCDAQVDPKIAEHASV